MREHYVPSVWQIWLQHKRLLRVKERKICIDGIGGLSGWNLRTRGDSVDGSREEALETMVGLQDEELVEVRSGSQIEKQAFVHLV